MRKPTKKTADSSDGNKLIIDVEVGDKVIQIGIRCPICEHDTYWLAEDHSVLFCAKCRGVIGTRIGDFTGEDITWDIGGKNGG